MEVLVSQSDILILAFFVILSATTVVAVVEESFSYDYSVQRITRPILTTVVAITALLLAYLRRGESVPFEDIQRCFPHGCWLLYVCGLR
jgi:hypothetical protein